MTTLTSEIQPAHMQTPRTSSVTQGSHTASKKRRHAQIDANRRKRETGIIYQLATLSGQHTEHHRRDRTESMEVAVERYGLLSSELPRIHRSLERMKLMAMRLGIKAAVMMGVEDDIANDIVNDVDGESVSAASEQSLTILTNIARSHTYHALIQSSLLAQSSLPLASVRLWDSRLTSINRAYVSRLQWKYDPQELIGLQSVDVWFVLQSIYRTVTTSQFVPLDTGALVIQATGIVNSTSAQPESSPLLSAVLLSPSKSAHVPVLTPLLEQPDAVHTSMRSLLTGESDVRDIDFVAPAATTTIGSSSATQIRRNKVWLTNGWQSMSIANVELIFHLVSVTTASPTHSHPQPLSRSLSSQPLSSSYSRSPSLNDNDSKADTSPSRLPFPPHATAPGVTRASASPGVRASAFSSTTKHEDR